MSWRLTPTSYSGRGSSGRNSTDSMEFIVRSSNVAADSALSEVAMMKFVVGMVGVGTWQTWKNGFYFGTLAADVFTYGISYVGPTSFISIAPTIIDHIDRELIDSVHGVWKINVIYRDAVMTRQNGDAEFSGGTVGGTQHITCGISVDQFPSAGVTAPHNGGMIGVDPSNPGHAAGIDIEVPAFKFKTTYYVSAAQMNTFFASAASLKGPVSSQAITFNIRGVVFTAPAHSLKYDGSDFQERIGQGDWALTHHWSYSPNVTNLKIGGIAIPLKLGWYYLEAISIPYADTASNTSSSKVICVNVFQVYQEDDLNSLIPSGGTGTSPPWA